MSQKQASSDGKFQGHLSSSEEASPRFCLEDRSPHRNPNSGHGPFLTLGKPCAARGGHLRLTRKGLRVILPCPLHGNTHIRVRPCPTTARAVFYGDPCSGGLSRPTRRGHRAGALLAVLSGSSCSELANISKDGDVALVTVRQGTRRTDLRGRLSSGLRQRERRRPSGRNHAKEPMDFRKSAFSILLPFLSLSSRCKYLDFKHLGNLTPFQHGGPASRPPRRHLWAHENRQVPPELGGRAPGLTPEGGYLLP